MSDDKHMDEFRNNQKLVRENGYDTRTLCLDIPYNEEIADKLFELDKSNIMINENEYFDEENTSIDVVLFENSAWFLLPVDLILHRFSICLGFPVKLRTSEYYKSDEYYWLEDMK